MHNTCDYKSIYIELKEYWKFAILLYKYGNIVDNCTTSFMETHTRKVFHQEHNNKKNMQQSTFTGI